jgi:hypothetical protein
VYAITFPPPPKTSTLLEEIVNAETKIDISITTNGKVVINEIDLVLLSRPTDSSVQAGYKKVNTNLFNRYHIRKYE